MRSTAVWLSLCAVTLVPSVGSPQGVPGESTRPSSGVVELAQRFGLTFEPNTPYGSQLGAKFIGAPDFSAPNVAGAQLMAVGYGFYAATIPSGFYAQLDLEPGVIVTAVGCLVNDADAAQNISFTLTRFDITVDPDTTNVVPIDGVATSGTPGIAAVAMDPPDFTFTTYEEGTFHSYALAVGIPGSAEVAGCWVYYKRQVAPGPAAATFSDVPTSSPYFKYVEALYASGIVAGCTATTYCPNNPVTRGQLAIFLASVLGMGYPW
jgi:hypothetical protein